MRILSSRPLRALVSAAAGATLLLATAVASVPAGAVPGVAVEPGGDFVLTTSVNKHCKSDSWLQVTPADATSSIKNGKVTVKWQNPQAITDGQDVRFTVQVNTPVEKCALTSKGSLSLDGKSLSPFQNDLAKGGSNLQVTWRAKAAEKPFDWSWTYPSPTCKSLNVTYPSNIPDGQANDANIRIVNLGKGGGEVTLNFHNNTGTWSRDHSFVYNTHPNWPGRSYYKIVWTQVGGTNYHWQGEVTCGEPEVPEPPVKPEAKTGEDVTEGAPVCLAEGGGKVEVTTKSWTQDYVLNKESNTWVLGEKVYGDPVVTQRDATTEECPEPETPEPPVKPETETGIEVTINETVCRPGGGGKVVSTELPWEQEYVLDEKSNTWVLGEITYGEPVTVERDATEEECPETEVPEPPVKPEAKTGEDVTEGTPVCLAEGGGKVEATAVSWTQDYVLDQESNTWVLGEKVYGDPVVAQRDATTEECPEPETPEPPVKPETETGIEVDTSEPVCLAEGGGKVVTTETPWEQEYVLDEKSNTWVRGEVVYGEPVVTEREATAEECPKPEVPEPPVKPEPPTKPEDPEPPVKPEAKTGKDVTEGAPVCVASGGGKVGVTTRAWSQDYYWDDKKSEWVLDSKIYSEEFTTTVRDATEKECPKTVTPPKKTDTDSKKELAKTGSDVTPVAVIASAFLLAVGSSVLLTAKRASRRRGN